MQSLSLKNLLREKSELQNDLIAWTKAYDLIQARVRESDNAAPTRTPALSQWSGYLSVICSLEMSIHAIQRTIEEHNALIGKINQGDLENADIPSLSLVGGTNDGN